MQNISPTKRLWRTLIRVVSIDKDTVGVIIPGYDVNVPVEISINKIPSKIRKNIKEGNRYHVMCNIGADRREDLVFGKWENK